MILISHRGNISGSKPKLENKPSYIDKVLNKKYDCEVDIKFIDNKLYLGHDEPQYKIDPPWLYQRRHKLWIHCKDLNSLVFFSKLDNSNGFNYFFHENDLGVLTSLNYIWSINVVEKGILVVPEIFDKKPSLGTLGICSDYIKNYKK